MDIRSKGWQKFWRLGLLAIVLFSAARIYFVATDDFRLSNMTYELPHHPEWDIVVTPELSASLDELLKQRFKYVAKGAQSYVFASEDGNHVLKFFKFKHLKPSWVVTYLPPISPFAYYQQRELARKQRKLYEVFNGHKLAYEVLKTESGLFFIQLNPRPHHQPMYVTVTDKLGWDRQINLRDVVFVVQDRGEPFRSVLAALLDKGDIKGAQQKISQIFDMYFAEYDKGVYDHDHGVMRNVGFSLKGQPIHLDIGKLMQDEQIHDTKFQHEDILKVVAAINEWVYNNYPEHHPELTAEMDRRLQERYGNPAQKDH